MAGVRLQRTLYRTCLDLTLHFLLAKPSCQSVVFITHACHVVSAKLCKQYVGAFGLDVLAHDFRSWTNVLYVPVDSASTILLEFGDKALPASRELGRR
jgi:hypothetical protein